MESKSSKKREAIAIFSERFEQWEASQEGQQDAYAFEESYVKFVEQTSREVLQQVVGVERDSKKKR
ncbi:MAG: hypothetical protein AAF600_14540 [Bacteroidota bacterium]